MKLILIFKSLIFFVNARYLLNSTIKMLKYYLFKKLKIIDSGFTLIELLVVTIIVGILTALSIPNFLGQIGKARETEASNQLGTIGRAQQAYHFETQQFAPNMNTLDKNIAVVDGYYSFPDPTIANTSIVKHQAIAASEWTNSSRDYAIGIYHDTGSYTTVLCRANATTSTVNVPDTFSDPCNNNGVKIK